MVASTYTSDYPFCTSYLWSQSPAGNIFTFFGCGEDSTSRVQLLYASTEGVDIGIETTTTPSSSRGSTVPDPSETDTSSDDGDRTGDPSTPTDDASNQDEDNDNDNDSGGGGGGGAPVGAIVGGVVGGLAVLSLLALGLFFLLRRNRNNNNNNNAGPNGHNPNNPAAQPFMATQHQAPGMNTGMAAHSPSAYTSIGYAGAPPAPFSPQMAPYNPHTSSYGTPSVMSPQPTGATAVPPPHVTNWATGAQPPPQPSPLPHHSWVPPQQQHQQGPPVVGWNSTGDSAKVSDGTPPQANVQELASDNPVGQYGGNNRAELG
jgi:hypothetical protein